MLFEFDYTRALEELYLIWFFYKNLYKIIDLRTKL